MDDFGNALHWTDLIRGFRSQGLYGWYAGEGLQGLMGAIDFEDLLGTRLASDLGDLE